MAQVVCSDAVLTRSRDSWSMRGIGRDDAPTHARRRRWFLSGPLVLPHGAWRLRVQRLVERRRVRAQVLEQLLLVPVNVY